MASTCCNGYSSTIPEHYDYMRQRLAQWGGNSSGVNIANIDNLGNVHPDTFWWNYNLGNVKERPSRRSGRIPPIL